VVFADKGTSVNIIYDQCHVRKGFPVLVIRERMQAKWH